VGLIRDDSVSSFLRPIIDEVCMVEGVDSLVLAAKMTDLTWREPDIIESRL